MTTPTPEYDSLRFGDYLVDVEVNGSKASIGVGFDGEPPKDAEEEQWLRKTIKSMLRTIKEEMSDRGYITAMEKQQRLEPYAAFDIAYANQTPFRNAEDLRGLVMIALKGIRHRVEYLASRPPSKAVDSPPVSQQQMATHLMEIFKLTPLDRDGHEVQPPETAAIITNHEETGTHINKIIEAIQNRSPSNGPTKA